MAGRPSIATEARVTSCRFQFARLSTFTLGIQTHKKFRITFDYYAHGQLYSDEFDSPVAIAQNERLTLTYDPLDPQRNSLGPGGGGRASARSMLKLGIAGSLVLSLFWLAFLRACS